VPKSWLSWDAGLRSSRGVECGGTRDRRPATSRAWPRPARTRTSFAMRLRPPGSRFPPKNGPCTAGKKIAAIVRSWVSRRVGDRCLRLAPLEERRHANGCK